MKSFIEFIEKENLASPAAVTLFRAVKKGGFKNRWLSALAALVVGFVLQPGLAAANPNLVTNPGFETGNTSGWGTQGSCTLTIETSQVHSGTYACEVSGRTQTYNGIAQSLLGQLTSGQSYNFSVWVRLVSGASQTVYVTVADTVGGTTSYRQAATGTATTNGWTQLSGTYAYNPSGSDSSLVFYVELPNSATASYYIDDVSVTSTTITPGNGVCSVEWTNVAQRIDGFGASSAWRSSWTSTEGDMFFGTNSGTGTSFNGTNFSFNGIGLSLLRNHIAPATSTSANAVPTTVETNIMHMAQAHGALVWSTPWTPPAGFKANNDIYDSGTAGGGGLDGGHFLGGTATNLAYASQLANYVVSMKNQGINIYAISMQNEPDAAVTTYEACQWTNIYLHDFITNLYNALVAKGVGSTKIILPESQNWSDPHNLAGPTLSDPTTAADVGIVADHDYGDSGTPAQKSTPDGQSVWETEVSTFDTFDGSISNAIYWADRIYLFMTAAQANAWHYWWLYPSGTSNEGLTDNNGIPAKRMYALGQFSRFVRPGYYRIDTGNNTGSALISAYKDPGSGNFAIVAINSSSVVVTQTFDFTNVTGISSVTPWITSATNSLDALSPVSVSGSSFSYALPAMSIITFVGQAGSAPSPVPTTLTLGSGSNPSTYGNTVTFTATVKTNGVAIGGISGETVTFYDGAGTLGAGTLNGSGRAAYTTTASQLTAATHAITAVYVGDSSYDASTNSPALSQTVNQATLTAGLTGTVSKLYNGTASATLTAGNYTLSSVVSGDTVTLNDPTSGTYDTKNVGTGKTVTVTGLSLSGASATNYTLAGTSVAGAVGTISQTNITITAAANSKTYDGNASAAAIPVVTSGSVQSGDTASFSETYASPNVGTGITLTPAGAVNDGNSGNNYAYTFVPSASGTISAATLTYTANSASMVAGAPVPALSGSVSGFVGSDNQGNATTGTLTFTTPATSASPAGSYAINGSGLTANNGNYTFVQAAGNATALTISPLVTPTFAGQGITAVPGGYQLSFSAQNGQTYKVLATSDLTLPAAQWTVVTNGTFGSGATTITNNSTNMVRFYIIVSP